VNDKDGPSGSIYSFSASFRRSLIQVRPLSPKAETVPEWKPSIKYRMGFLTSCATLRVPWVIQPAKFAPEFSRVAHVAVLSLQLSTDEQNANMGQLAYTQPTTYRSTNIHFVRLP
jgi:hypothetical protein